MGDEAAWRPLRDELQRWTEAGKTASLWFRDDDATAPTEALDRLLALSDRFAIPMTLAVIPAFAGEALSQQLMDRARISVAVHGWSHGNHAPEHEKKQELGSHRPLREMLQELQQGFVKLQALFPARFVPILVPPWNRIAPDLLSELPLLGYRALSIFGSAKAAPIGQVNTHVDIMDWHGTGGCRPHEDLIRDLVRQLRSRFEGSAEPIGILTHHLVHDDAAWDFIAVLFEETMRGGAIRWHPVGDFLQQTERT